MVCGIHTVANAKGSIKLKTFIVHFYKKSEDGKFELIVAASGIGDKSGDAVESAIASVKDAYPEVLKSLWTAYETHMTLTPGRLDELMPKHHT